jgi:hypothetical protein
MSRLISSRRKQSTILVSKRTVEDALRRANALASAWMAEDQNDPKVDELQRVVDHLSSVMNKTPQQMRADGAASIEDYFDDAKMGDAARTLKREVDMIAKWHRAQRPAGEITPEQQGIGYVPEHATKTMASAKKKADGAGFVTDRDEKGEPKAPEKIEVPRVAAKKKEAVPEAAPVAAPAAAPAAPPATLDTKADIGSLSSEALAKAIKALTGIKEFETDKAAQAFIEQMASVLKNRPIEQEEPKAPAAGTPPGALGAPAAAPTPALPVAASKKSSDGSASAEAFVKDIPQAEGESALPKHADLGDHAMGGNGDIGGGSGASTTRPASPARDTGNPEPTVAPTKIDLGGLSMASADDDGDAKTADDYRLHDFKLQDEGIAPTGKLPNMDEQEQQMHPEGEFEKESVAPPHSEEVVHALKKEKGVDNPFAVAWSMHNKGDKMSAVKAAIAAVNSILASGAAGGGWSTDVNEKGKIVEDGGNLPEVAEAHAAKDEAPARLDRPATTAPIKLAADMTCSKAVKQSESLGDQLKKMYLEAKGLTSVNDTRPVREAVESIFRSADMFDEATKALNKQQQQEESEAAAQEIKAKNKKSSYAGLALAAAE